jgi:hypothetical protein
MRLINSLAILLATVSVTEAFSSPHDRAHKHKVKRSAPVLTKDAPRKRSTGEFLTNKTASMFPALS